MPQGQKVGRKSYVPSDEDRAKVKAWAVFGHTQESMAEFIGISKPTLAKYFSDEIRVAKSEFDALAISGLAKGLRAGEGWAVQYYLRTRGKALGWSERIMLTGNDDPFRGLDLARLSPARFRLLMEILAQAGADLTMAQQEDIVLINGPKATEPSETRPN